MEDKISRQEFLTNLAISIHTQQIEKIKEYEVDGFKAMKLHIDCLTLLCLSSITSIAITFNKPYLQIFSGFMQDIERELDKAHKDGIF